MQFNGYKIASSYCRKHRGGGGVCILLHDSIESIDRTDITDLSIEYVIEVCAIELPKHNILLLSVYWNRNEEDIFYSQLKLILNYVNCKYSKLNIVLGGDFNIDILDNNLKAKQFLNLMLEYNFTNYIKTPTRVTQTTSTCLDLIFVNFKNTNFQMTVQDLGFSDHFATIMQTKLAKQINKKITWFTEKECKLN